MLVALRLYRTGRGQRAAWVAFFEGELVPYLLSKGVVVASFVGEQDEDQEGRGRAPARLLAHSPRAGPALRQGVTDVRDPEERGCRGHAKTVDGLSGQHRYERHGVAAGLGDATRRPPAVFDIWSRLRRRADPERDRDEPVAFIQRPCAIVLLMGVQLQALGMQRLGVRQQAAPPPVPLFRGVDVQPGDVALLQREIGDHAVVARPDPEVALRHDDTREHPVRLF